MAIPKVYNVGEYYMNKDFIHAKNECLYATTRKDTTINQIYQAIILNLGRKNWCNLLFISTCNLKVNL